MKKLLPILTLIIVVTVVGYVMFTLGDKNDKVVIEPETTQKQDVDPVVNTAAKGSLDKAIRDYYADIEKFMSTPTADKNELVKLLKTNLADDYIHYDVFNPKADLMNMSPDSEPKGKDLTIYEIQEDTKTFEKTSMNVELLKIEPSGDEAIVTLTSNYQTTEKDSGLTVSHRMYCIDKFRMNQNGHAEMYYCICKPNNESGE